MTTGTTGGQAPQEAQHGSMKDAVVEALRADIVSGALPPGTKLSEARLAERFGTSRMPVREALQVLARADFVVAEQRRGTFVRGVSQRQVVDLFEVREAIEGMAARLCASRASAALLASLDEIIERMRTAAGSDDSIGFIAADEELHSAIFEGSANERLLDHYGLLIDHLHRNYLSTVVTRRPGRMARSFAEHQAIVEAIRMRNADMAEQAMRQHVRLGLQELAEQMVQTRLDA
ncbi:MAG TPA: GntR family transcriptional regulator [Actinoplanes sp.]|nr:GntR family transcriptional regulator [Actinoplanes sp.]